MGLIEQSLRLGPDNSRAEKTTPAGQEIKKTVSLEDKLNTVFENIGGENLDLYLVEGTRRITSRARKFSSGLFDTLTNPENSQPYSHEDILSACRVKRQEIRDSVAGANSKKLRQTPKYQRITFQRGILSSLEGKARYQQGKTGIITAETNTGDILEFIRELRDRGKSIPTRVGFHENAFHLYAIARRKKQKEEMRALKIKPREVEKYVRKANKNTVDPIVSIFKAREDLIEKAKKSKPGKRLPARIGIAAATLIVGASGGATAESRTGTSPNVSVSASKANSQLPHNLELEIAPLFQESTSLPKELATILQPEQELYFQDPDGKNLGIYRKILFEPQEKLPEDFLKLLNNIEGPMSQETLDFFTKFAGRNILALIDPNRPFSGGSDQAMQLIELLGGNFDYSLLNSSETRAYHHPEAYGPKYLTKLIELAFLDQNEIPSETQQKLNFTNASIPTPNQLTGDFSEDTIKMICAKFETFLFARKLVETHGEKDIQTLYANFVPLAATKDGLPIYGLPAASQYLFGKKIEQLNQAEQLVIIGIIQAPAEYLPNHQFAVDRAKTLLQILENKKALSSSEITRIKAQLDNISFSDPNYFNNEWINDLPVRYTEQVYRIIDSVYKGEVPPNAEINGNKIFVTLERPPVPEAKPSQTRNTTVQNLTPKEITSIPFKKELQSFIEKNLSRNEDGTYVLRLPSNQEITIPEFEGNPGFAVEMVDVTNPDKPFVLAEYDGSGILSETPFPPGSTFKAFVAVFLIDKVGIEPFTYKISNSPGKYTLLDSDLTVRNANIKLNEKREDNQLTLAEALAYSSNVPFQKLMKEYLDSTPNGWQIFTDYLENNFGLKLYNVSGNPLTEASLFGAIGSDDCVYLADLARAFGVVANPSQNLDPETRLACKLTCQILQDQSMKKKLIQGGRVWGKQSLELFEPRDENGNKFQFKTGTVSIYHKGNIFTSDTAATGFVITPDGRKITMAVRLRGQREGKTLNLESIKATGSRTALPIARSLLQLASENPAYLHDLKSPQQAIELLQEAVETPEKTKGKYQVAQIRQDTALLDIFGNPVLTLSENQSIDIIGKAIKGGLVPVSLKTGPHQITTGFVEQKAISERPLFQFGDKGKLSVLRELEEQADRYLGLKYVLVSPDRSSPLLSQISQDLRKRGQLMSGPEDYQALIQNISGFDTTRTVFVNESLLSVYLGKKFNSDSLTFPQYELMRIIARQQELLKLKIIFKESRTGTNIQDLCWDNSRQTPSNILLNLLIRQRITSSPDMRPSKHLLEQLPPEKNYAGEDTQKVDLLQSIDSERLLEIIKLFNQLMNDIDNNKRFTSSEAKTFVNYLAKLNLVPTTRELANLGIGN